MPHHIHVAKPKPKTKSGAAKPGSRKNEARLGLLKKASAKVAKAAAVRSGRFTWKRSGEMTWIAILRCAQGTIQKTSHEIAEKRAIDVQQ